LNGEAIELAQFPYSGGLTEAYRSLLYLDKVAGRIKSWSGPAAIDEYLAAETKGRLVQSLKSFLTSRSLKTTDVFGRRMSLEELIARILRDLREKAETQFGEPIRTAVVGRPVRFVGAEKDEDNSFAEQRLGSAYRLAGYESVEFELEPVAAAHYYESTLDHDELILIGDFGGGTSDFSLLHVGPSIRKRGRTPADLLGNSGVGIAGDAFDARIVRNLVSPALGRGSEARSMNKVLPAVPNWVYGKLERWHHLSFLRTSAVINMLSSTRAEAFEPEKIDALLHLIKEDLGYELHRSVQRVKRELSEHLEAPFHFSDGVIEIAATVKRSRVRSVDCRRPGAHRGIGRRADRRLRRRAPRGRHGLPHRRLVLRSGGAAHFRIALRSSADSHRQRIHFRGARVGREGRKHRAHVPITDTEGRNWTVHDPQELENP
jgi:hypothetical chaperone protein